MDKIDRIVKRYLKEFGDPSEHSREQEANKKHNEGIKNRIVNVQKKLEQEKVKYQKAKEHHKNIKDDKEADEFAFSTLQDYRHNIEVYQSQIEALRKQLKK